MPLPNINWKEKWKEFEFVAKQKESVKMGDDNYDDEVSSEKLTYWFFCPLKVLNWIFLIVIKSSIFKPKSSSKALQSKAFNPLQNIVILLLLLETPQTILAVKLWWNNRKIVSWKSSSILLFFACLFRRDLMKFDRFNKETLQQNSVYKFTSISVPKL